MKITYFYRRPLPVGHFSIEFLFDTIQKYLPESVTPTKYIANHFSQGIFSRIKLVFECAKQKNEINHITGDIHYIALGLPRENTILTIHDLGFLRTGNPFARMILKLFWVTLPAKRVAAITVVSEATKQELLQAVNIDPNKVHVIGNFISDDYKYRPKLFNADCPVILQIGCAPNKNIPRLAEALQGIKCKLVVIGNLSEQTKQVLIDYKIDYAHKSKLTEAELREEYYNCDILSFVSLLEGFGMPILEAQTTGRVVLTSNISAMPSVAGDGALLVDPLDVSAIRDGVLQLIKNEELREKLVINGLQNIKRFSINNVVEQYCLLYQNISQKNGK